VTASARHGTHADRGEAIQVHGALRPGGSRARSGLSRRIIGGGSAVTDCGSCGGSRGARRQLRAAGRAEITEAVLELPLEPRGCAVRAQIDTVISGYSSPGRFARETEVVLEPARPGDRFAPRRSARRRSRRRSPTATATAWPAATASCAVVIAGSARAGKRSTRRSPGSSRCGGRSGALRAAGRPLDAAAGAGLCRGPVPAGSYSWPPPCAPPGAGSNRGDARPGPTASVQIASPAPGRSRRAGRRRGGRSVDVVVTVEPRGAGSAADLRRRAGVPLLALAAGAEAEAVGEAEATLG